MMLADVTTPEIVSYASIAGTSGIVALAVKSLVWDKRGEGRAMIDGYNKGLETARAQVDKVGETFEQRIAEIRKEHAADMAEMRDQMDQLRAALSKFVALVDPARVAEAAAILADLHLAPVRREGTT